MRKTSGVILIILSCIIVVVAIADRISYQKYTGESGTGETLGFAIDINGFILTVALLVLAVFLFIRGRRLLRHAAGADKSAL